MTVACPQHHRVCELPAGTFLDVGGLREARERSQQRLGRLDRASLSEHLGDGCQQSNYWEVRGRVGRRRLEDFERLVPAARQRQRVAEFRKQPELPRPIPDLAGERDPLLVLANRLVESVAPLEQLAEVVVGAEGSRRQVVLERQIQGMSYERQRMLVMLAPDRDRGERVECLRENLREPEIFGNRQRGVDPLSGKLDLTLEPE
jgi:hypothetical protein